MKEYTTVRPEGAPPTMAEQDPNLLGAIPAPPEWRVEVATEDDHHHDHGSNTVSTPPAAVSIPKDNGNGAAPVATVAAVSSNGAGAAAITGVTTQTVEAVEVELSNSTRLLICPL